MILEKEIKFIEEVEIIHTFLDTNFKQHRNIKRLKTQLRQSLDISLLPKESKKI